MDSCNGIGRELLDRAEIDKKCIKFAALFNHSISFDIIAMRSILSRKFSAAFFNSRRINSGTDYTIHLRPVFPSTKATGVLPVCDPFSLFLLRNAHCFRNIIIRP